jgi:4-amino-4-deoxy-L-arabinose transferase-like glycosyltransferase
MNGKQPALALRPMVSPFAVLPNWWTKRLFPDHCPCPWATPQSGNWLVHFAILLPVAGLLLFTRLSCALLEPDETRYAEIPRQMLVQGQFAEPVWHGQPYYHKPPLLYWLVMGSYRIFGVHDWAARLVPTLASLGTVLVTYGWGRRAFGARTGFVSAVILCLSASFIYFGRMLTIDALLCLWVLAALATAHQAVGHSQLKHGWWILSASLTGLGLLTKGPVASILVLVPTLAFQLLDQRAARPSLRAYLGYLVLAVSVASPWYLAMIWTNPTAAGEFFWLHHVRRYFDPIDHEEPIWFFLPGLLLGTLPWSLALIPLVRRLARANLPDAKRLPPALGFCLLALLWCVGFFSLSGCKRAVYILPALPLLALCSACWIVHCPPRLWRVSAVLVFAVLLVGIYEGLPRYHRKFALRGQIRSHAGDAAQFPVLCYPKRWDSVTFYLQRQDVRVFTADQRAQLLAAAAREPSALLVVHGRSLAELRAQLPPSLEFVAYGRQSARMAVGKLQATRRDVAWVRR